MLPSSATASCLHLIGELGHVVLQAALVVRLLAHLHQDVEVAVLLSQRRHPLVLTQLHCNNRRAVRRAAESLNTPPEAEGGREKHSAGVQSSGKYNNVTEHEHICIWLFIVS